MKKSLWIYLALIFVLSFDIWTNNSDEAKGFYAYILEPIDKTKFSLTWTFLVGIGLIIWFRERLILKEKDKDELKQQMKSRMELLVMANQELSEYRMRDLLISLFQSFVSTNPYVLGVQLYDYTLANKFGIGTVRLKFVDGYVRESVDVNAAQQLYYSYSLQMMREFQEAQVALFVNERNNDSEYIDPTKLIAFIQKYNHSLSIKQVQSITEEDSITYAFVSLGIYILESVVGQEIGYIDPDRISFLQSKKRTGFLQSILLSTTPYTFSHHGNNEKADRQYIASPFHVNEQQYLYVIVLDADVLVEFEYHNMLNEIADGFEARLQKCFKTVYTSKQKGEDTYDNES